MRTINYPIVFSYSQRFLPLKEDALLEGLTPENVHAQSLSKLISGEF